MDQDYPTALPEAPFATDSAIASGRAVPVEPDVGDVKVMLNQLDDAVQQAHKAAAFVEERVQPVLSPFSAVETPGPKEPKERSPLAMLLDEKVHDVRTLVERLQDVGNRIQL